MRCLKTHSPFLSSIYTAPQLNRTFRKHCLHGRSASHSVEAAPGPAGLPQFLSTWPCGQPMPRLRAPIPFLAGASPPPSVLPAPPSHFCLTPFSSEDSRRCLASPQLSLRLSGRIWTRPLPPGSPRGLPQGGWTPQLQSHCPATGAQAPAAWLRGDRRACSSSPARSVRLPAPHLQVRAQRLCRAGPRYSRMSDRRAAAGPAGRAGGSESGAGSAARTPGPEGAREARAGSPAPGEPGGEQGHRGPGAGGAGCAAPASLPPPPRGGPAGLPVAGALGPGGGSRGGRARGRFPYIPSRLEGGRGGASAHPAGN